MKKTVMVMMSLICVASAFSGCGDNTGGVVSNPQTLNIRVYKAGYGDAYVKGWIDQFEETYSQEGYKINVVEANDQIQASVVTNEMILGKRNQIDLYITANCSPSRLYHASEAEEMDMIAADLNDVFASKPIGADKTEEDITIEEKLKDGYAQYFKWEDSYYGFPYRSSCVGLVVNPQAYSAYATEYPRTTDEFLTITDVIRESSTSTGVYPYAFAGFNAFSYLHGVEDVWVAQYAGKEYYADLCSLDKANSGDEAAAMLANEAWVESLNVIKQMQDPYNCARNSINDQHTKAQAALINGKAVFMVTGHWLQNEMYKDYSDKVVNMEMIKTPVISALGVKLGLDGNNGADKEKCDDVLSTLVKCVDENKAASEVISEVSSLHGVVVTEAQYTAVQQARGIIYEWGIPFQMIVNAYSPKVDIAKLFLRYIASDDAAKIAFNASTSVSPYESDNVDFSTSARYTKFIGSVDEIGKDSTSYIYRWSVGKRSKYQIDFFNTYQSLEKTLMTNRDLSIASVLQKEQESVKKIWSQRIG